jgi:serine/threonine protein kinase
MIPDAHLPTVTATLASRALELRDEIGHGGFATVYTAFHQRYQQLLAVKIATITQASWLGELDSLRDLCHPSIVNLYDVFQDEYYSYFVLEYCPGGTLRERIKNGQPCGVKEFRDIASRLLEALVHCHSRGIAHLDIKPENVLFGADGKVRLADFGCSQRGIQNFFGGSLPYMAPEILCKVDACDPFSADIWSLGITFYFIASGKLPWHATDSKGVSAEIRLGSYQPLSGVDQRILSLIMRMLKLEPSQRAAPEDLLETIASWRVGTAVAMLTPITSMGSFRARRVSKGASSVMLTTSLSFAGRSQADDPEADGSHLG